MPGDPLRAKFIAENYLEEPVLVNNVRGVQGYTGRRNGARVSVMASGMGQPSMGIYSYELFNFFGVEQIIRIGSCGAFSPDLHVRDRSRQWAPAPTAILHRSTACPEPSAPLRILTFCAAPQTAARAADCAAASATFYPRTRFTMTPDPAWIGRKWAFSAWKWSLPPCTAPQPVPLPRALHLHGERLLRVSGRVHLRRRARDFLYRHDGGRAGSGVRQERRQAARRRGKPLRRAAKNQGYYEIQP